MTGIALMLPGQGSQYVGMGGPLADAFPAVRELYERADDTLGTALSRLCREGPEEELTATQNAQPAILLHSYAVWSLLEPEIGDVIVGAGHSLGEFTAHLIAGTLAFEDALRIVRRRGELMAASGSRRPGTMAAVIGLEESQIAEVCDGVAVGTVVPANINAPGQIVISGDVAAVEAAGMRASEVGARRVIPLNVSGAFHSPLMEVAVPGLAAALDDVELSDPAFPIVANASAELVRTGSEARETLLAQLTSPVRWTDGLSRMREMSPATWLELGPGAVLGGLLRRFDRELRWEAIGDPQQVDAFLEARG